MIALGIIRGRSYLFSLIRTTLKKYIPLPPSVKLDLKPLHRFAISPPPVPCTFSATNVAGVAEGRTGVWQKAAYKADMQVSAGCDVVRCFLLSSVFEIGKK